MTIKVINQEEALCEWFVKGQLKEATFLLTSLRRFTPAAVARALRG